MQQAATSIKECYYAAFQLWRFGFVPAACLASVLHWSQNMTYCDMNDTSTKNNFKQQHFEEILHPTVTVQQSP